ncbi:MAG: DUF427 domain-containing protein [Acidimicrobiia bacterium]|nr:DUF427 domain-containing protein [Acidimicrobiia bacterium]
MQAPPIHVEPTDRHIRVRRGDLVLADSHRAQLLVWFGPGVLPTYAIPADDVAVEHLRPSADPAGLPHTTAHDVVADTELAGVAFRFDEPPEPLAALDGWWTFAWEAGLAWFEEATEVHVHARDTRKRVDAIPSDRHIRVEVGDTTVAESERPLALFETMLPTRWYLPFEDVRTDLLEPSGLTTSCPYKGTATYWSLRVGDTLHEDIAWSYPDPIVANPRIAGLVCFFNERVDLTVDGERVERPDTPWSVGRGGFEPP